MDSYEVKYVNRLAELLKEFLESNGSSFEEFEAEFYYSNDDRDLIEFIHSLSNITSFRLLFRTAFGFFKTSFGFDDTSRGLDHWTLIDKKWSDFTDKHFVSFALETLKGIL